MDMGTAMAHADAKPGDVFSHTQQGECQNFIRSLASVIGPE